MKNFIIQNLGWFAVAALILFILSTPDCASTPEKVYTQSDLTKQRLEISNKYLQQLADSSEVIQEQQKLISDGLKPIVVYKTLKAKISVAAARADTNTTPIANTAIDDQETLIFDLGLKSYSDSIQLAECTRRQIIKDSIMSETRRAFNTEVLAGIENSKVADKKTKANRFTLFIAKAIIVIETTLLIIK